MVTKLNQEEKKENRVQNKKHLESNSNRTTLNERIMTFQMGKSYLVVVFAESFKVRDVSIEFALRARKKKLKATNNQTVFSMKQDRERKEI